MSTRANIIVKDNHSTLWFYRHSDGYPEGTMPTLEKFLGWVKDGRIRDNAGQAAGWLILIGCQEYADENTPLKDIEPGHDVNISGWKVGAYEPTTGQHGDIEYLYTVDLATKEIKVEKV